MKASRRNALCIIAGVTFLFAAGMHISGRLLAEDRGATVGGDGSEDARHKEVEDYVNEFDKLFGISAGVDGGWSFIEKETKVEGNGWCDPQNSPGVATPTQSHSEKAIPDSQKEPENFSVKLHGKLTKPGGEGQPPTWSVSGKTDFFWIEAVSPANTDGDRTVYVGYGSEAKFKAEGGDSQTKWKMSPKSGSGQNNIPDDLLNGNVSGAALTVPAIGKDGENPIAAGEYTISADKDGSWSGTDQDSMTLVIVRVDIDVDTNNDGAIDNNNDGEDEYEEYAPGVIICIDRKGDEDKIDHLVEMKIRPLPSIIKDGTFVLDSPSGSNNIKLWEDKGKTSEVSLPKEYNIESDAIPETLYIDGVNKGNSTINATYKTKEGIETGQDNIVVHVTSTISWAPSGTFVYSWAPCYRWELIPAGIEAINSQVKDFGWNTTRFYFKDPTGKDNDVGTCTLANFQNMRFGGIVAAHSHGNKGFFVAVYCKDKDKADEWRAHQPSLDTAWSSARKMWYVYVDSDWFANTWSDILERQKSIVVIMSCHSADGGKNSVVGKAGGRVGFGYTSTCTAKNHKINMNKLFGRLNGGLDNALNRVVKDAYAAGGFEVDYGKFVMITKHKSGGWTTLHPAPLGVFPAESSGLEKGSGAIVFDTYMLGKRFVNIIKKISGTGTISEHRWFRNSSNYDDSCFGMSFDFEKEGVIKVRAQAKHCESMSVYGHNGRLMAGDLVTYASDKDWSF